MPSSITTSPPLHSIVTDRRQSPAMAPKERLALRLRRLRDVRGLSQTALAEKARISRGYLARLEAGQQDPTLGVLERLAKALRVPVTELLG